LGVAPPGGLLNLLQAIKIFKCNVKFHIKIRQSKLHMYKKKQKIGSVNKLKMMLWFLNGRAVCDPSHRLHPSPPSLICH